MADIYKWITRVKTVNGHKIQEHVKVKMTSSEVKSYIMRVNNWTSEQYRKQYDLTKNKLRAYQLPFQPKQAFRPRLHRFCA